jgi:predicted peroxiredoxin
MKKLFLIISLLAILGIQACKEENNKDINPVNDGIFVHISHGSDDVHRALMGLQMAVKMSEDKDVIVYFDISGIDVVLKDSKDYMFSDFPSSKTQLNKLISKGVPVMVCPGCLKAANKTESDLMDGVKIADRNKFFEFTSGRILTIDY